MSNNPQGKIDNINVIEDYVQMLYLFGGPKKLVFLFYFIYLTAIQHLRHGQIWTVS